MIGIVESTQTRIMYIESKDTGISGPARNGRVTFSETGKSLYYRGRLFQRLPGGGSKANYFDSDTREEYWISGCKKRGGVRLCAGTREIDEDVREEYWTEVGKLAGRKDQSRIRCAGKCQR